MGHIIYQSKEQGPEKIDIKGFNLIRDPLGDRLHFILDLKVDLAWARRRSFSPRATIGWIAPTAISSPSSPLGWRASTGRHPNRHGGNFL